MESPPVVRYPYTPPAGTTYGAGAAGAAGPEAAGPGTAGAGVIGPGEDCDDDDDGAPVPKVAAEEAAAGAPPPPAVTTADRGPAAAGWSTDPNAAARPARKRVPA